MGFLSRHWFLIALILAVATGFGIPEQLQFLVQFNWLSNICVATTMFLMSWPLRFGEVQLAVRQPLPALWGSTVNVVFFPLVAWPLALTLGPELGPGLIVLAATPCTLASASVWTRRAGGNDVVAMMVTIITNGLCFVVTPLWIYLLTGSQLPAELVWDIVVKLFLVVVIPLTAGQLMRINPTSAKWSTQNKTMLSVMAQLGLLIVVLLGSTHSGLKLRQEEQSWTAVQFVWMFAVVVLLHVGAWWFSFDMANRMKFPRRDAIATAFAGSQKTLMVGLVAAIDLQFSVIPLVTYHVVQLTIDTFLADWLKRRAKASTDFDESLGTPLSAQNDL
jgi:sodium/bile acid cotransporter 7